MLGKKVGNKAVAWGAVGGLIPDLDVLTFPFLTEVQQLAVHRGFSHSFAFAILMAPLLGWMISRIHLNAPAGWRDWGKLAFWSIVTHPILDTFTVYGTQLFQPFSDYPAALSSIFIIDPLYTVPLLVGVGLVLFLPRETRLRRRLNTAALIISTAYLLLGLGIKLHVQSVFQTALQRQEISFRRVFTNPTPFNIILWMGMGENAGGQWVGLYSLLDADTDIRFEYIPKNRERIADVMDEAAIRRLLWFSRGYYTITETDGELFFNDLRFGRSDGWLGPGGPYVFGFRLIRDPQNPQRIRGFRRISPHFETRVALFTRLLRRIQGDKSVVIPYHGAR